VEIGSLFDSFTDKSNKVIFYELYIEMSDNNKGNLIPVPVKIVNYINVNGESVNTDEKDESISEMNRRFFLVDTFGSIESGDGQVGQKRPRYIRYIKDLTLRFDLVRNKYNGEIYPPLLIINYDYQSADNSSTSISITFNTKHRVTWDSQSLYFFITLGVLSFFNFLVAIFSTWSWSRRSGRASIDFITIFKFIMFYNSTIGYVIYLVLFAASLYWFIFYRGQTLAYIFLPESSSFQQSFFIILLGATLFVKLIDVIYLTLVQTSYDIFFIDWEPPKYNKNKQQHENSMNRFIKEDDKKVKNVEDIENEAANVLIKQLDRSGVSCWRLLFVANEWNELQTFRKVNPFLQFFGLLFFLKVVNLEVYTFQDCSSYTSRNDNNDYIAPFSPILRIALVSIIYWSIGNDHLLLYIFFNN
jgi:meckelin